MNEELEQTDPEQSEGSESQGVEPQTQAEAQVSGEQVEAEAPGGRSNWLAVYLAAFVLVVAATAVMAFGGLSLLRTGSTIQGSTTLFWVSIVLAVVSIVLAGAAVVLSRKR